MSLPITYLFVPGDRPERFEKALTAGADAVVVDLEDAVAPANKERARASVRSWFDNLPADKRGIVVIRINDSSTQWYADDVELVSTARIPAVMVPKAQDAQGLDPVRRALPSNGILLPLLETARGIDNAASVASAQGVQRLVFGTLDYGIDLDLSGDDRGLMYAAARIAHASREAELVSPVYGVTPAIDDDERLRADVALGRAFGFGAKLCIHPRQVAVVRGALLPTPEEVDWARRVVAAAKGNEGSVQLDGKMVDRPVVLKAMRLLDTASS